MLMVENEKEIEKQKELEEKNFLANQVHGTMDAAAIETYVAETKIKTVEFLCYGDTLIEVWYYSPLPTFLHGKVLYICPFCLSFFSRRTELE